MTINSEIKRKIVDENYKQIQNFEAAGSNEQDLSEAISIYLNIIVSQTCGRISGVWPG